VQCVWFLSFLDPLANLQWTDFSVVTFFFQGCASGEGYDNREIKGVWICVLL